MAGNKTKSWPEKYEVLNTAGKGGNGEVHIVRERKTKKKYALKELKAHSNEQKRKRFEDEIEIMCRCSDVEGVIPIINSSKTEYWYVMPVATPIVDYIKENELSYDEKIDRIIEFAAILEDLHQRNISHRDIKPANLYILDNKCYFGDFGLVEFPGKIELTQNDRKLGATFTIAPEMKRNPDEADGKKADVYSFAKTIWMFLTLNEQGFEGQYDRTDRMMAISLVEGCENLYIQELEEIIHQSTANHPDDRPGIGEVVRRLKQYRETKADFYKSHEGDWQRLSKKIFGDKANIPSSSIWEDIYEIVDVLNKIGGSYAYNHLLFSDGGGQDFNNARKATEAGCIEVCVDNSYPIIVKPKHLLYQGFSDDHSWDYFVLECDDLPYQNIDNGNSDYEILVEDYPGHYVVSDHPQYGVYDYDIGDPFPEGWRIVSRYNKGKFLILLKFGMYNAIDATYDGRHAKFTQEQFREYVKTIKVKAEKLKTSGADVKRGFNDVFRTNPFSKDSSKKNRVDATDSIDTYVKSNYERWVFDIEAQSTSVCVNIRFKLCFNMNGGNIISRRNHDRAVLSKAGKFENDLKTEDTLWIYDRAKAISLFDSIRTSIKNDCNRNGYVFPEWFPYLSLEMERCGNPNHLFTLDELSEKMRQADDRHRNTIVINENGEVEIIRDNDFVWSFLYPVRNESFDPGNQYVGKYAEVEKIAKDLFPSLLDGWRDYLKTGVSQRIDYKKYDDADLDSIKGEIKQILQG